MPKKQKTQTSFSIRKTAIVSGAVAALVGIIYIVLLSMIPVNGTVPIFGAPSNTFVVANHSADSGYVFITKSTTSGKKSSGGPSHVDPSIHLNKGELESIHLINEDKNTNSKHNINIDEFNVHSRDLGYFESQTITFIADKTGSFDYYCSIHPEMKGTVVVE